MAAILVLGAKLCEQGVLTVGEITAFLFYMMQILMNFMILASVIGSVMSVSIINIKFIDNRCVLQNCGVARVRA